MWHCMPYLKAVGHFSILFISTGSWSRFCICTQNSTTHWISCITVLYLAVDRSSTHMHCAWWFLDLRMHTWKFITSLLYIELLASRIPAHMVSGDFSTCMRNPVRFIAWVKYWSWGESSSFFMCDPKTFTFTSPFWRSRVVSEYAVLKNLHQWFMHTKKDWGCLDS